MRSDAAADHVDVVIVGAGLSGIGAAAHLKARCPNKTFTILEARNDIGGTWDLFRYPGIRSDSDMYTLGYSFKPWLGKDAIADGASIKRYIADTAAEHGFASDIRYGHKVLAATWSSAEARWTLTVAREGSQQAVLTCSFLMMCSGYYSYEEGHRPGWPGEDRFAGTFVHPQFWPSDLAYEGRRVVVIGSGATAVTLVPEMARKAAHVTMLQRSPTYIMSTPAVDATAERLKRAVPARLAYALTRWKNVLIGEYFFRLSRRKPDKVKGELLRHVRSELGDQYDVDRHFTPAYNPWDQRLCAVPDADLFGAIRRGVVSVVTDRIETFTATGIRLASGEELAADVVVTATGLKLQVGGGIALTVDGREISLADQMYYKGCMFSDVPNLAMVFGYTNASWTLKADLISDFVCRILHRMDATGATTVVPRRDASVEEEAFLDFSSGYVQRSLSLLPRQGKRKPWKLHQSYPLDMMMFRWGRLEDGTLEFRGGRKRSGAVQGRVAA